MQKIWSKMVLLGLGLCIFLGMTSVVFAQEGDKKFTDYFPDPAFAKVVASELGREGTDVVTQEELNGIKSVIDDFGETYSIEGIENLPNLEHLFVGNNPIKGIPDEIRELKKLSTLMLENNQIEQLPEGIGYLESLSELVLDQNRIRELPESMVNLSKLSRLWANGNQILEIPDYLGELPALSTLQLQRNQIKVIPSNLNTIASRGSVYLGYNKITAIPDSFGWTELVDLNLDENFIDRLPDSFRQGQTHAYESNVSVHRQILQLSPHTAALGEFISEEMLVPEIVLQLCSAKGRYIYGTIYIMHPDHTFSIMPDWMRGGNMDVSFIFDQPGEYTVSFAPTLVDWKYYHTNFYGKISSSRKITILPEEIKKHQVDVTVKYLDGSKEDVTTSYDVNHGGRFQQKVDVLEGYTLASAGMKAFPVFDYDIDTGVVSLDPVEDDYSIVLEFDKEMYRVALNTVYTDGSREDVKQVDWIRFGDEYVKSYELPEEYEIGNRNELLNNGIQIDDNSRTLHIGGVRKDYDIQLELQKKAYQVVVRVVYEDGSRPDAVSTWEVLYGDSFYGDFYVEEGYSIKKVTFNALGISVNRIQKSVTINRVTGDVEVAVIVR